MTEGDERLGSASGEGDLPPFRRKDLADCPVEQFSLWLDEASRVGLAEFNACSLATVDDKGRPIARAVLLKGLENGRFVFFTNFNSRKSSHLRDSPFASMHFPWFAMQRQVTVTGEVSRIEDSAADEYFHSRPYFSKLGAWASRQSESLDSRETLERAFAGAREKFGDEPPRPPHWGGFALEPESIEFWQGAPHRLHDRFLFERKEDGGWEVRRLYP